VKLNQAASLDRPTEDVAQWLHVDILNCSETLSRFYVVGGQSLCSFAYIS
jgi:hypothetical protein